MNVSCTRSSRSPSGAPALARKRASARACRRTSSAAAGSSPPCQAAISAASVGTAATGSAGGMRVGTGDVGVAQKLRLGKGCGGWGGVARSSAKLPYPPPNSATPPHLLLTRASPYVESSNNRSNPMRPYDERLDHFLSRAAKVFAGQGYHSTTMRDLAAATDMSLAGMYYYVRGKEELLFRIQERCFMRVLAGAEGALAGVGEADPGARLQAFIRHHVTFFAAHMAEMKVLSHEANSLTGERLRKVNAIKRRYVDLLEGLLKDVAPDESAMGIS